MIYTQINGFDKKMICEVDIEDEPNISYKLYKSFYYEGYVIMRDSESVSIPCNLEVV